MRNLGTSLLVVNPAAQNGNGAKMAAYLQYAAHTSHSPFESLKILSTASAGDAQKIAAQARGYDTVVAVGGDGTINEVVNGLMTHEAENRPAFALVPCGNGNDYARTLGMSFNAEEALAQLSHAVKRKASVGVCNGRYFVETLSFGLDAAIANGTHERRKRTNQSGTELFLREGINQLLFHLDEYPFSVRYDDQEAIKKRMYMFAVQVGVTYGGGFKVCPSADAFGSQFSICCVEPPLNVITAAKLFLQAKNGNHVGKSSAITFESAKSLCLDFDEPVPCQLDGETMHGLHFEVSLLPQELSVFCAQKGGAV